MRKSFIALAALLVGLASGAAVLAAPTLTNVTVTPSNSTANQLYTFSVTVNLNGLQGTLDALTLTVDNNPVTLTPIPAPPVDGTKYQAYITSSPAVVQAYNGSNTPATLVNFMTADQKLFGLAKTHTAVFTLSYTDTSANPPTPGTVTASVPITVHDTGDQLFGGIDGDRDFLVSYPSPWPWYYSTPYEAVPDQYLPDPLTSDAGLNINDDGSSSSYYTFNVVYVNEDGLPPLLWSDLYLMPSGATSLAQGVYLNISKLDPAGNYIDSIVTSNVPSEGVWPWSKLPASYKDTWPILHGAIKRYNFTTGGLDGFATGYSPAALASSLSSTILPLLPSGWSITPYSITLRPDDTDYYEGLKVGRYHWFWSASDDDARYLNGLSNSILGSTLDEDYSNGNPTGIVSPGPYAAAHFPSYGSFYLSSRNRLDNADLIDRPALAPDPFTYGNPNQAGGCPTCYQNASNEDLAFQGPFIPGGLNEPIGNPADHTSGSIATHPFVTVGLRAVANAAKPAIYANDVNIPVGGARFLGTLSPYKRVVNSLIPDQGSPGLPGTTANVLWSETAGGSASQVWTFRVIYQGVQPDPAQPNNPNRLVGKAPDYVDLNVYNTADASGPATVYKMTPEVPASPASADYMNGVVYRYDVQLAPGPHCYNFTASDGVAVAVFPRRPKDTDPINADPVLPFASGASFTPVTNQVINGPYVNSKPVLGFGNITPASGEQTDNYTYTVTYSDADGQRPYQANLIIETAPGQYTTVAMHPTSSGPVTSSGYQAGVVYTFSTTDRPGLVLTPGLRHFYFQFTDDWGRVTDPNDRIQGETVTVGPSSTVPVDPNNTNTQFLGPTILTNRPPTLYDPQVNSDTGLAITGSDWTFQVTYSDLDNNPPAFVDLVLGQAATHKLEAFASSGTGSVVVTPANANTPGVAAPKVLYVVGVWTTNTPSTTDTNYYTGGNFDPATGTVTLGTPLPAAGQVYVTYLATPIVWQPETDQQGRIALIKQVPSDTDYLDGVVYVTAAPIRLPGPNTPNVATDPPQLYYYAFEASDGIARASYGASGIRPSPGAFDVESGALSASDLQNYTVSFGGYPASTRPDPVSPVLVGPLAAPLGSPVTDLPDVQVNLTDTTANPPATTTLTKGGGAVKTQFSADYALGKISLGASAASTDAITSTYWFAAAMPPIQYNIPPTLTSGQVSPLIGSQFSTYTYSVVYTDIEGLNGQPPTYVDVIIDGVTYPMTPVLNGLPIYRNGVDYTYQTTLSPGSVHTYHFEASDGYAFAVFDGGSPQSRSAETPITPITGIDGPFINDAPILQHDINLIGDTGITPDPFGGIRRNQPVTYDVWYRDSDNDPPAGGYPMAWIGGPNWDFNGGVISQVYNSVTLVTDQSQHWSPSQFANQPITWTTGKRLGVTDHIIDNTANTLIILNENGPLDSDPNTMPQVSDQFSIQQATGAASAIDYRAAAFVDNSVTSRFSPGTLAGERLQMETGTAVGNVYTIFDNTAQTLAISARQQPNASADPTVGTDGVLSGDSYSLHDLLVGQITLNLNDNGLVSMKFGNTPGWVADQFDGLVVQMLTGPAIWKNYTILNNTTDTLYLAQAASLVQADGVQTGNIGRVAGLKMDKVDPTANDYTLATGVQYYVTVPGLGLGLHDVQWFASNSPVINGTRTTYQARLPAQGTQSGPLVINDPPPGDSPPVLSTALGTTSLGKTTGTSLDDWYFSIQYQDPDGDPPGPHDGVSGYLQLVLDAEVNGQIIRRTYQSSVDPVTGGLWPKGVARTINSTVFSGFKILASQTPLPPGTHRFHFEASDGWYVVRYPENEANDPSIVVNSKPVLSLPAAGGVTPAQGNSGTKFTFQVMYSDGDNQAPAVLNSPSPAIGVILTLNGVDQTPIQMTQANPSNADYIDGVLFTATTTLAPGTYSYRFIASDGIENATPTPSQTGPVVRSTNNAPSLLSGSVSPASSAFANNAFTYSVRYTDPDGDVPSFVRVTILAPDGVTVLATKDLTQADPTQTNYADPNGILYTYQGYQFASSGAFNYQFSASDGLLPAGGTGTQMQPGPTVNFPPVLSNPSVNPLTGLSSGLFTFSVTYADTDNAGPTPAGYVRVVLTPVSGNKIQYSLSTQATSGWSSGVVYQIQTQLAAGTYSYHFEASDGLDTATNTTETPGLTVIAAPALSSAAVSPPSGASTDTYTYSVTFTNPDGTAPSSIQVFIDGTDSSHAHDMTKVNPQSTNYAGGVQYQYQTTLTPGTHTWFIQAVASNLTIYPAGQTPSTPVNGPTVNNPPVLTLASVNPLVGYPLGSTNPPPTNFTFDVTYSDADGVAPGTNGGVWVNVSGVANPIAMTPQPNAPPFPTPDWSKPVTFQVTTQLPAGQHTFYFTANDGLESARLPIGAGTYSGPRVSSAPQLLKWSVSPTTGTTSTTFVYSVTYQHPDNFPPAPNSVAVLIDGTPFQMLPQSSTNTNYTAGVVYVYSTTLSPGSHTYAFQASDGVNLVSTPLGTGPTVSTTGLTINASANSVPLGATVTLSGSVIPAAAAQFTITLTRPDGSVVTKAVSTTSAGAYSTGFIADQVGQWTASIAQNNNSSVTATLSPALTVQPATLRVQGGVVDMICSPVITPTGDPAGVFGASAAAAMNIVRWDTALATYEYYGSSINFPPLDPGSAFWIRPNSTMTLYLTGSLSDQTQPIAVSVLPGWNQIGSGFVQPVTWAATQVVYNGQTFSLAQAAANNWVRDYAWGYDPVAGSYFLVRGTGGQSTTLDPYRGYWLRALVPCQLLIQPPGTN